jgi:hypothetical protein
MSGAILEAGLLAQHQHEPPAGAHLILVAAVVLTGLVLLGVSRWRKRRDTESPEEQSTSPNRAGKSTSSAEDE